MALWRMGDADNTMTTPNSFERLLMRLTYHIGEGELDEAAEDRIIEIEERWLTNGTVRSGDLLWLQETLRKLEEEG